MEKAKLIGKTGSLVFIIELLYFVSPIDIVPDFLPARFVDDVLVLGLVFKQVGSDLINSKFENQVNL